MATYRTFFGLRVWDAPILKLYWPFMISGSTAYFLFASAQVALRNDPNDKWAKALENVKKDDKIRKVKTEATEWYEAQLKDGKDAKASHH